MKETIPYLPGLSPVAGKKLHARFDGGRLSSDGGVLLLREIENRLGLAERLSSGMRDQRAASSTTHSLPDMIRAPMLAIACGYEDCDDLLMSCVLTRPSNWLVDGCLKRVMI